MTRLLGLAGGVEDMSQGSDCSLSATLDLFDAGVLGDDVYDHDSHSDWNVDELQGKPTAQKPDSEHYRD